MSSVHTMVAPKEWSWGDPMVKKTKSRRDKGPPDGFFEKSL